jgi:hypothetical protein
MRFTIDYDRDAEDNLADIWLGAADPAAVTRASAAVEHALATNPMQGDYLSEGLWRFLAPPLAVHYSIDTPRRHVQITHVGATV